MDPASHLRTLRACAATPNHWLGGINASIEQGRAATELREHKARFDDRPRILPGREPESPQPFVPPFERPTPKPPSPTDDYFTRQEQFRAWVHGSGPRPCPRIIGRLPDVS